LVAGIPFAVVVVVAMPLDPFHGDVAE